MPLTVRVSTRSATSSISSLAFRMALQKLWSERASRFGSGRRVIISSAESASSAGPAPQGIPDGAELQGSLPDRRSLLHPADVAAFRAAWVRGDCPPSGRFHVDDSAAETANALDV